MTPRPLDWITRWLVMSLTNEWKAKREAALKVGVNKEKGSRSLKLIYNVLLKLVIEYIGVHFIILFWIEHTNNTKFN